MSDVCRGEVYILEISGCLYYTIQCHYVTRKFYRDLEVAKINIIMSSEFPYKKRLRVPRLCSVLAEGSIQSSKSDPRRNILPTGFLSSLCLSVHISTVHNAENNPSALPTLDKTHNISTLI